jgi:hypothetical protein
MSKELEAFMKIANTVCVNKKDFVKLVEGYQAFMEFAPNSNFDGSEQKFYDKMEDLAIGSGCYKVVENE